ncbi:MAG: hypothetical protein L3J06_09490 [Cyclobacteriaceae bacterium]|nr:hypothetical protein [Cyclobacteriaceae bacterium]
MKNNLLLLLLGLALNQPLFAQDEEINVAGLIFLNYTGSLPETIRSGKTIVLVNTTKVLAEQTFNKTAEPLIEEAHAVFTKAGIDVVGYYSLKQIFAGKDSQYGFSEAWKKREIKNIIVLSRVVFQKKKKEVTRYVILASKFNGKPSLYSNGQVGWKAQGKDFDKVLAKVASAANKYNRKNLLINDSPEFFDDVKMVWGEHVEGYLTDLDFGKMAVPTFKMVDIPSPKPTGVINNLVAKQVEESNALNVKNNKVLTEKMKGYDYRYELVDPSISDIELSKNGFSYILQRLYAPGIDIKKLLNYKVNEDQDTYTTQIYKDGKLIVRRIPANGLVYKYYIKHLRTGNIYLGPKWDADETWGEALDHMLYNVKVEMKR